MPIHLELTLGGDEIGALCDAFGLPLPTSLRGSSLLREDEPDRYAAFSTVMDRLLARGALGPQVPGGDPRDSDIAKALDALASPEILLSIHRQTEDLIEACVVGVQGRLAAEHQLLPGDTHRISLLDAAETFERVKAFCHLKDQASARVQPIELSAADLLLAGDRALSGDVAGAQTVLRATGTPPESAKAFTLALAARRAAVQVTLLRSTGPNRAEGSTTAWLDAGDGGLWRVPAPSVGSGTDASQTDPKDLDQAFVRVEAITAKALIDEILEGMEGETPAEWATGSPRA